MRVIEITPETAALGTALGLTTLGSDGVYDLTPKGSAWLDEWLKRKLSGLDNDGRDKDR